MHQSHDVLQLVAKTECTARLVERGAAPQARRDQLIQKPTVGQHVQRLVGCVHLNYAERLPPKRVYGFERIALGIRPTPAAHQIARLVRGTPSSEPEHNDPRLPWGQIDVDTQRCTGVERSTNPA